MEKCTDITIIEVERQIFFYFKATPMPMDANHCIHGIRRPSFQCLSGYSKDGRIIVPVTPLKYCKFIT